MRLKQAQKENIIKNCLSLYKYAVNKGSVIDGLKKSVEDLRILLEKTCEAVDSKKMEDLEVVNACAHKLKSNLMYLVDVDELNDLLRELESLKEDDFDFIINNSKTFRSNHGDLFDDLIETFLEAIIKINQKG